MRTDTYNRAKVMVADTARRMGVDRLNLRNAQDNITAGVAITSALIATSPSKEIAIASYSHIQYAVKLTSGPTRSTSPVSTPSMRSRSTRVQRARATPQGRP